MAGDAHAYAAFEKAQSIPLVGQSHLPAKCTLDKLGTRATFCRWYDRYCEGVGWRRWATTLPDQTVS